MDLFNEYYSSEMQFLFDLFCLDRPFTKEEAIQTAKQSNVYSDSASYKNLLKKWVDAGLLRECGKDRFVAALPSFAAPLNAIESEYLSDICSTNEASLFGVDNNLRKKLGLTENTPFDYVMRQNTTGKKYSPFIVDHEVFQCLLKAISQNRQIKYEYCTNADATVRRAVAVPYKLEYSVFDGRWWLISYNIEENRVIKSRLENLIHVDVGETHDITEDLIRTAIATHLCPTSVVLRIRNQKNALERCFIAFENMMEMTASDLGSNEYELKFRFFEWDKHIIVRKLMFLGEMITVQSPQSIVEELCSEIRKAIGNSL